jgi:hypothetical protein
LQPAKHSSERTHLQKARERKKHSRCLFPCHRKLRNPNFDRDRRDSRCKFGSARLNWRAACVAFILQRRPRLSFLSLSRSSSPERRGTSGITAAKPLLPAFYLMITYIHVYVSEGCEQREGRGERGSREQHTYSQPGSRERARAGVLRHSL